MSRRKRVREIKSIPTVIPCSPQDRVRQHAGNTHDVIDIMQIPVESRPSLALQKLFPEKRGTVEGTVG